MKIENWRIVLAMIFSVFILTACGDGGNSEPAGVKQGADAPEMVGPKKIMVIEESDNEHLPRFQCVEVSRQGQGYDFEPIDCDAPNGEVKQPHEVLLVKYKAKRAQGCSSQAQCDDWILEVKVKGQNHSKRTKHTLLMTFNDLDEDGQGDLDADGLPVDVDLDAASHPDNTDHSDNGSHGGGAHLR